MCYVLIIDKFELNCTFLVMLSCRCDDGFDLNLGQGEVPDKRRAFVGDDARRRIVNNERDAVGTKGDCCRSPQIMIRCGKCNASMATTAMLLI